MQFKLGNTRIAYLVKLRDWVARHIELDDRPRLQHQLV
jgi:hypothetical protein